MNELKKADLKVGDRVKRKKLRIITLSEGVVTGITKADTEIIWVDYDNLDGGPVPECAWIFRKQSPGNKAVGETH